MDLGSLKLAIDLFGAAFVGLQLPDAVVPENNGNRVVPFTTSAAGGEPASQPDPANGHCVIYVDYDESGLTAVTWGQLNPVSWEFHQSYCDEAYAVSRARGSRAR